MGTADWARVGRLVRAARRARGETQVAFAGRYGLGSRTRGDIETGRRDNFDDYTRGIVEDAILGWAPGSLERVLAGGKPELKRDDEFERLTEAWHALSPAARAALVRIAEVLRAL